MSDQLFSKPRSFDFLEKQGLEKLTDTEAGNWHLYILKELIDNALDANEVHDTERLVSIYFASNSNGNLVLRVENTAPFPIERVKDLFNFEVYWSSKDYVMGVTRGKQGNGLKTILSIPYALRVYCCGDYDISHTPVLIISDQVRAEISIHVDPSSQSIQPIVKSSNSPNSFSIKTLFEVRLAHYFPENSIRIEEVVQLAKRFAFVNPDTRFIWTLSQDSRESELLNFNSRTGPIFKLRTVPALWYRSDRLRKLLQYLACHAENHELKPCDIFWGLDHHLEYDFRKFENTLTVGKSPFRRSSDSAFGSAESADCGQAFSKLLPLPPASFNFLEDAFAVEGSVVFETINNLDSNCPFVLDIAILRSEYVASRTVMVALNHSPLLRSPFDRKKLPMPPGKKQERMYLSELLTELGIGADEKICILIHFLHPTVEFQSFGKSEFDMAQLQDRFVETLIRVVSAFLKKNPLSRAETDLVQHCQNAIAEFLQKRKPVSTEQIYYRTLQLAKDDFIDRPPLEFERFVSKVIPVARKCVPDARNLLIRDASSVFVDPYKSSVILWLWKDSLMDVVHDLGLLAEFRLACFVTQIKSVSESMAELSARLFKNRTYKVAILHDADSEAAIRLQELSGLAGTGDFPNFEFFDLGLRPSDASALEIRPIADKRPISLGLPEKGWLGAPEYDHVVNKRVRYDLFAVLPEKLLVFVKESLISKGVVKNIPKAALNDATQVLVQEQFVQTLKNRLIEDKGIADLLEATLTRNHARVNDRINQFVSNLKPDNNSILLARIAMFCESLCDEIVIDQ